MSLNNLDQLLQSQHEDNASGAESYSELESIETIDNNVLSDEYTV